MYKGYDDPAYEADIEAYQKALEKRHELLEQIGEKASRDMVEKLILISEELASGLDRLFYYSSLLLSANTENSEAMAQKNRVMKLYAQGAADEAAADKLLGSVENAEDWAQDSELFLRYRFFLKEKQQKFSHMLSNEEEAMIASMKMSGSDAWSALHSYLTSTVKVDYEGKQVTLSEIRNLAYDADPAVRKAAYDAELACYEKIQDSVAFALNNIKNETIMLAQKRGYESPLAMTLEDSRMSRKTLDAMMEAVQEYLPVFRKYLRKKGELLGHKNGIPFYDLFAPVGKADKSYSIEEAGEVLQQAFRPLASDMADLMQEAFEHEWIDFYPRKGKEGGAFCAELFDCKQSRILTNYDGSFSAIDTLAHELGHAFHNLQLQDERQFNRQYPMPVAETASTFNEVHLGAYALKHADEEEKLALLESDLRESTQCIVDIYSRYYFESQVFERCQNQFLMAEDLKEIMLEAQQTAYGDGMDPAYRHPYMWVCKGHYYMDISFYNFPYAFGNLFAQGLYATYLKEGESFLPKYREMLRLTGCSTIEECGAFIGVDLTDKKFWENSLALIAERIDEFCKLA